MSSTSSVHVLNTQVLVMLTGPSYMGGRTLNSYADLLALLAGTEGHVMNSFCQYLATVRQLRRKMKVQFEQLGHLYLTRNFACRRTAWRMRRKAACRHGVLFSAMLPSGCKCGSSSSSTSDWSDARFVPALCEELKCIIAVPFVQHEFVRLGFLQAEARRRGW